IEKAARKNNSKTREQELLAKQAKQESSNYILSIREECPKSLRRTPRDYASTNTLQYFSSIVGLLVNDAKNFEIKLAILHIFVKLDHKDHNTHVSTFFEFCDTVHVQGVQDEVWGDAEEKFLTRFFPPSRFIMEKKEITIFTQNHDEPIYEI
ncbi:hypothetical protein CR513_52810, partial [Mucuna pruriens]